MRHLRCPRCAPTTSKSSIRGNATDGGESTLIMQSGNERWNVCQLTSFVLFFFPHISSSAARAFVQVVQSCWQTTTNNLSAFMSMQVETLTCPIPKKTTFYTNNKWNKVGDTVVLSGFSPWYFLFTKNILYLFGLSTVAESSDTWLIQDSMIVLARKLSCDFCFYFC